MTSTIPPGFCRCGCGQMTTKVETTRNGMKRGEYYPYAKGHNPKSHHNGNRKKRGKGKSRAAQQSESKKKWLEKKRAETQEKSTTATEQEQLDREQMLLNIAIDSRMYARAGIVKDPGRVLPREEVDALLAAGKITYIDQIPEQRFQMERFL